MPPFDSTPTLQSTERNRIPRLVRRLFLLIAILLGITVGLFSYKTSLAEPPTTFPISTPIAVEQGWSPIEISEHLESAGVVRSATLLYWHLRLNHQDDFIQAGVYNFPEALRLDGVAEAITQGEYLAPSISFTLPEGYRIKNLLTYLPASFSGESVDEYLSLEGFLFPDTYFITQDAALSDVVTLLKETYEERIKPFREDIEQSGFTEREIIILASILEREANDDASMREVAGVLKHRLSIDMPLQVDATFDYLLGKESSELTLADLELDSPYNTYTNIGLPPTPIANPGLRTIEIAIQAPISPYLYYLTGKDGTFYYAKTFEEHVRNKQRYLR